MVAGSLRTTAPPMATSLVEYSVESLCISFGRRVSFSEGLCAGVMVKCAKGDRNGGDEIGGIDGIIDLTCTSLPVKCD